MIRFSAFLIEKQYINLSLKGWKQLSSEAQEAIDSWESYNWTGGTLEQSVKSNDNIAQEIERVFAPIRENLGKTIKLYRGMTGKMSDEYVNKKFLESWTDSKKIAEGFAGLRGPNGKGKQQLYNTFSDAEIKKAVDQYNKTGFVTFNNKKYTRYKEDPKYFNVWSMSNSHITVSDNLEDWLRSDNEMNIELNTGKLNKIKILEETIKTKDIIWITNNLGSREFIVRKSRH
jgi:hypothetical protein